MLRERRKAEKNVQANREYAIKYKSMYNVYMYIERTSVRGFGPEQKKNGRKKERQLWERSEK